MNKIDELKILLFDIETLPHLGFFWGRWKQNIPASWIMQQSEMLCLSYKWLHATKIHNISPFDEPKFKNDSYAWSGYIAERFIPIMNQADFVVAHNGDSFDYPKLKAYCVINNLPSFRVRKVDTLKMAKSTGMFPKGNRLDDLAEQLGVAGKAHSSGDMWIDIALRRKNMMVQMAKMIKYCNQDVSVLESVFMKLWPHCESILPNIHTLTGGHKDVVACDRCGSDNFVKNGRYIKNVLVYQRHLCNDCGATFLGRKALDIVK